MPENVYTGNTARNKKGKGKQGEEIVIESNIIVGDKERTYRVCTILSTKLLLCIRP